MKKEALKVTPTNIMRSGALVMFRDGNTGIVVYAVGVYTILHNGGFRPIVGRYCTDLSHMYNSDCDIVKILKPVRQYAKKLDFEQAFLNPEANGFVVTYEEQTHVEVSMDQVAKLLGVPVSKLKIIK